SSTSQNGNVGTTAGTASTADEEVRPQRLLRVETDSRSATGLFLRSSTHPPRHPRCQKTERNRALAEYDVVKIAKFETGTEFLRRCGTQTCQCAFTHFVSQRLSRVGDVAVHLQVRRHHGDRILQKELLPLFTSPAF